MDRYNALTKTQKANLIHLLLIFPFLLVVLTRTSLPGLNPETLRKVAIGVVIIGAVAHAYAFAYKPTGLLA